MPQRKEINKAEGHLTATTTATTTKTDTHLIEALLHDTLPVGGKSKTHATVMQKRRKFVALHLELYVH